MIELAPETACILYLAICLVVVVGIWLSTRKKQAAYFSLEQETCEFCSHSYIKDTQKTISRCPQCHLVNKRGH